VRRHRRRLRPGEGTTLFQAKGYPYALEELFGPTQDTTAFRDGCTSRCG
jgi:hypothetical protein